MAPRSSTFDAAPGHGSPTGLLVSLNELRTPLAYVENVTTLQQHDLDHLAAKRPDLAPRLAAVHAGVARA